MKLVTALFHSYRAAKQALGALNRHRFGRNGEVTVIDQNKVSPEDSPAEAASSSLDVSLVKLGIPAHKARSYAKDLQQGSRLIIVKANNQRALEALNLLHEAGAVESDYQALTDQGK